MTTPRINEQEIANTRHILSLLRSQVKSGHIDQDYMMRQIDKISDLMERVEGAQKQQKAAGRFEALYNVSRMLGTSLDLQTVLDQVMDAVISLTGAERGFIMLRDDDGVLQVEVARNLDQQTLTSEQFQYSRTIANHVLDSGEAILTTNAVEDPRFAGQASIISQSLRSIMAAPLMARGRVIGIAYVENRIIAGLFSDEDLNTLEALIGQASVAIDNALLFSETDQALAVRLEELRQLRRIDLKLSEKLDLDDALMTTLESACQLADADVGHLGLLEPSNPPRIRVVHQYHYEGTSALSDAHQYLDELYPNIWEVVQSGKSATFEHSQHQDQQVLAVPVLRKDEVIGVMVLMREDDSQFSAEHQDLVERVVVRAAIAIENAQLYAAVQAADKAKSEFVGIVAHDLKAPMTSISGYAELMKMQGRNLEDRQVDFLTRISNTVRRMEMLVSDLADISRIESGRFYMNEIRTSVDTAVEAVRDVIMPQMQERQHKFVENIEPDLPDMWVDYYRLMQVLTNLLSNAYKYTPNGGTVTLHVKKHDEKNRIRFAVQDTGIGLSEEGIRKLGTKFWRADDDYTRSQPGTGLGFAITASLIEQMGSKIKIESEIGKGSIFSFSVQVYTGQTPTSED